MADIDFSLLDVPRSEPVEDPEAYLRAAIAWHFGEDTGSAFWLRTAATLGFNPMTDVNTFADLRLVSQPRQRIAQCAGGGPHPARLRRAAAAAPDIRIRRHHRRAETDCAAAGLGRAGCPVADRGLRHRRLSPGPGLPVPDAERAARCRLFLAAGFRAARRGLPRDRHRSPLGQEDRRPRRGFRSRRLRRACHRAGRIRAADAECREPAHHSAAARGHRPERPGGRSRERQDPLPVAQRRARGLPTPSTCSAASSRPRRSPWPSAAPWCSPKRSPARPTATRSCSTRGHRTWCSG